MQTYPELSTREQWQLLLWMARHPVPLLEDTLPAGARLRPRGRRASGARRRLRRRGGVLLSGMLTAVLLALALIPRGRARR